MTTSVFRSWLVVVNHTTESGQTTQTQKRQSSSTPFTHKKKETSTTCTQRRERQEGKLNLLEDKDPDPKHQEWGTDSQERERESGPKMAKIVSKFVRTESIWDWTYDYCTAYSAEVTGDEETEFVFNFIYLSEEIKKKNHEPSRVSNRRLFFG